MSSLSASRPGGGGGGLFAGLFLSCLFLFIVVVYYVSSVCLFCRFFVVLYRRFIYVYRHTICDGLGGLLQ